MATAKLGRGPLIRPDEKVPEQITYLDPDVQKAIKKQVREVWERVRSNLKLNQEGLATALGIKQSNVSRLLSSESGHPWTPVRLKAMAQYLSVDPLDGFIPIEYRNALRVFFDDFVPSQPIDSAFLAECVGAINRHCLAAGFNVPLESLQSMGGALYARLKNKQPTLDDMQREIQSLVIQRAFGI